jgi:hypothetical protein
LLHNEQRAPNNTNVSLLQLHFPLIIVLEKLPFKSQLVQVAGSVQTKHPAIVELHNWQLVLDGIDRVYPEMHVKHKILSQVSQNE